MFFKGCDMLSIFTVLLLSFNNSAQDYCVVDVLTWGGMGGRDTNCKVPLIILKC